MDQKKGRKEEKKKEGKKDRELRCRTMRLAEEMESHYDFSHSARCFGIFSCTRLRQGKEVRKGKKKGKGREKGKKSGTPPPPPL